MAFRYAILSIFLKAQCRFLDYAFPRLLFMINKYDKEIRNFCLELLKISALWFHSTDPDRRIDLR